MLEIFVDVYFWLFQLRVRHRLSKLEYCTVLHGETSETATRLSNSALMTSELNPYPDLPGHDIYYISIGGFLGLLR